MPALIDAVGAFIIGGLLLLVMVNAMFNIQSQAINIEKLVLLTETSENISTILTDYLNMAGAGSSGEILDSTGVNRLRFSTRDSSFISTLRIFDIIQGDSTSTGYPLEIYVDGDLVGGPFMLSEPMIVTYFNENDEVISMVSNRIPTASLPDIRYIRMEVDFYFDAYSPLQEPGPDPEDPHNTIVLWRYFINTYL